MKFFIVSCVLIVIWAIFMSWKKQSQTLTVQHKKTFVHLFTLYISYLIIPCWIMTVYAGFNQTLHWAIAVPLWVLLSIFAYARFIEPNTLRINYHKKTGFLNAQQKPVKIALIADLHIGLFSGRTKQLAKIVEQLNAVQADMVIVAGDWTYEPNATLPQQLNIFKQVNAPIYSVMGNHDEGFPGPPIRQWLQQHLAENNIIDIEAQVVEFDGFYLIGTGDLWAGRADLQDLARFPVDKPFVIVSHNPDTAEMLPEINNKCLMLSGHTHGGQVKVPYLTDYYLRSKSDLGHNRGWYSHTYTELFVTVGTGMVGIPYRFRTPPSIDVIELSS